MTLPLLQLTSITKSFGAVRALRGVSFDLRPGEVHALVGENGAGKSTLIKVITGALQPDRGSIEIEGRSVERLKPASAQDRKSTRLNSSHGYISYAVFCLKKKKKKNTKTKHDSIQPRPKL